MLPKCPNCKSEKIIRNKSELFKNKYLCVCKDCGYLFHTDKTRIIKDDDGTPLISLDDNEDDGYLELLKALKNKYTFFFDLFGDDK